MIETEIYEKDGLIMTCVKCYDYHKIPLQFAIPLKTMDKVEAQKKLREIESAIKLQELVKVRADHIKLFGDSTGRTYWNSWVYQELQSLIEQSQKTVKEEGKAI